MNQDSKQSEQYWLCHPDDGEEHLTVYSKEYIGCKEHPHDSGCSINSETLHDWAATHLEAAKREAAKAYGGCTNCYGKGWSSYTTTHSGHDTDQDIGSPGGRYYKKVNEPVFCKCDRGKQLKLMVEAAKRDAEDAVIAIAHRKPCDCNSTEHFPVPVRSVTGGVTFYCQFSHVVPATNLSPTNKENES